MERLSLPSPTEAREIFLRKLKFPTVIEISHGTWPHEQMWSPSGLALQCGDISTAFRVWSRHVKDRVMWENDCDYVDGTFSEFNVWVDSQKMEQKQLDSSNPFSSFQMENFCIFASYKYMHETFGEESPLCQAVQWDMFGFHGRSGAQTTFWCGSEGAYTPCHFDSYGCNIVVQLHGRKRWTLFSPDQSEFLYSTRLPYEESSIFSEVNIAFPDTEKHPLFKQAKPLQVILNPGEALFVPKHWWHHVEALDTAVSVNTWIELESDNVDRLKEAITRTIVCAMKSESNRSQWSTPTEIIENHKTNLLFLHLALKGAAKVAKTESQLDQSEEDGDEPADDDLDLLSSHLAEVLTAPSTITHIAQQLMDKAQSS